MKVLAPVLVILGSVVLTIACSSMDSKAEREVASAANCESVYAQAQGADVTPAKKKAAADTCANDTASLCNAYVRAKSDGPDTGDGRLVEAICALHATYGANVAVSGKGTATEKCEKAFQMYKGSPASGAVYFGVQACNDEVERYCTNVASAGGVKESCLLEASRGAFNQVSKLK